MQVFAALLLSFYFQHILVVDIVPSLKAYNGSVKAHKIIRVPRPEKKSDQMSTMQGLQNPLLGMFPKFVGLFMDFANLFKGVCEGTLRSYLLIPTNCLNSRNQFPTKVVYIGGIVRSDVKPLAEEIKSILENSKKGAILLSFGSIWDSTKMSEQLKLSFLKVFSKFPEYDFIWKLKVNESDIALFRSSTNLRVVDWMDQGSILAHPKLVAFISHCGQNSLSEAAHSGVPLVGIPLFGDQVFNAALMRHKGIGEYLDIKTAEYPEVITEALEKVLNDPKYRQNAELIRKKLQLAPFKPEERLVKWVEFAAEFPELNELNLPTVQEMGFMAYYSLDVIFVDAFLVALALPDINSMFSGFCLKFAN
ncbi:UDP-glucoronosyl and UDP-glucosyl transferase domain-containing protein [Ditylenchus destructor]|uniref:UDP-glucuronosyltransferase n=1 Tax=Ditylenchus destructor TaxID=166010 RepID=A0AAD4MER9_9BILA|nr:UDP-glucoronosyl and UDP-glucosyl transferase domain-containing protein [Ditylenchus destructor]